MPLQNTYEIDIDITRQQLVLLMDGNILKTYPISSAKNGCGELNGSECTPRGKHLIRAKIGDGHPVNSVFVARRTTGEVFSESLRQSSPERDWILTRILWLSGLEKGYNRGGEVDTMRRYIYIHGCPDKDSFDSPSSHGCIKMRNNDVVDLFDMVTTGTHVYIHE